MFLITSIRSSSLCKERHHDQSKQESANVRPPCNAARAAALDGKQTGIQLRHEPEDQKDERGDLDDRKNEKDGHETGNTRVRKENEIRAQYASHRAARADHGNLTGWQYVGLQESRRCAAEQIKDQISEPTHARFDVIAKDEQHPHVVDDMEPAPVQKHGREDGPPLIVWITQYMRRYQTPLKNETFERRLTQL